MINYNFQLQVTLNSNSCKFGNNFDVFLITTELQKELEMLS